MMPLDPDRTLALSYVPAGQRDAVAALWRVDAALGAVLVSGREPAISQIKLAWWREALERLDNAPPPAEPVLEAAAEHCLPNGITGDDLAGLEQGWAVLLAEAALEPAELDAYAARGGILFALTARLLGETPSAQQRRAGEGWALADLARHSGQPDADAALAAARERLVETSWSTRLRPLGMLAAVARRDVDRGLGALEPQGAPARMWRMLRMRLTSR